jgi:hypothetical protein
VHIGDDAMLHENLCRTKDLYDVSLRITVVGCFDSKGAFVHVVAIEAEDHVYHIPEQRILNLSPILSFQEITTDPEINRYVWFLIL